MEPLEEARWALFQCRIGHPDRANLLDDVAYACMTRFERLGDPSLLEEAVELHREALDLRPSGHPDRPESLNVLGCALSTRYELFGDLESLSEAIKLIRQALDLLPTGHRDRSASLNNLALTLVTTFEQSGNLESLAEAIDLHRQALSDRPAGHSRRSLSLSNLAVALTIKFEHLGDLKLLAEAVDLHREALSLRPLGHPRRSATLNNLASAVRTQFDHSRDLGLLAEAVELHRQALDLRPPGHFERDSSLSNLGNALWSRFQEVGDLNSLTEAVGLHREALNLRPVGHSHHSTSLNNLAAALHTHFGHTHDLESLEEAIELNRRALHLRPAGHPDRPSSLNNLATMIRTRFEQLDDLNSLAEAVELHRQALDLRPPGHPERPWAFKNLADTLQRRFERLNGIRHGHASRFSDEQRALDLHEAIRLYRAGLSSCADDDPSRINLLFSIGKFLLRPERNVFDFEDGLRHILEALQSRDTSADDCLSYAVDTLRLVEASYDFACDHANTLGLGRHYYDEPVLQIYILVIQLLPRAASFGLDHARRLHKLSGADVISRNAATRAIVSGREAEAVEMLEEGRGVFWSQALRLRTTDLDLLPALDSQELRRLFQALDLGGARDDSMSAIQRERHVEERRRLSSAAEALITEIRSRPAMSRFLLPPAFFSLVQSLPEGGAFVILVASSLGHRALVLDRINAQTTSLELLPPGDGFLSEAVRVSLPRDGDSEEGLSVDATVSRLLGVSKKASRAQHKPFDQTLAQLWASIVKPVIGVLGLKVCLCGVIMCPIY
jgi:tetratricopeptide (TPR) repeat protein